MLRRSIEPGQYTAIRYAERLADAGAVASIGSVGDSYDNAMAESVIGLSKLECIRRDGPFRTTDDEKQATEAHSKDGVPTEEHRTSGRGDAPVQ